MKKWMVGLAVASCLTMPRWAAAQQYLLGGRVELGSGVEQGGRAVGLGFHRARTLLRLGGDVRIDEAPNDALRFAANIELEPRAAVGFDVQWARRLSNRVALHAGGVAFIAPSSLYGIQAGMTYSIPLGSRAAFTLGPTARSFFLGADLPDGTVLFQGLVLGGIRADL
jgi:hypothetical protein